MVATFGTAQAGAQAEFLPSSDTYMRPSSFFALVRDERIPEFVKHPLSLKVYYANPRLYGWGGIIVGMLALCVGARGGGGGGGVGVGGGARAGGGVCVGGLCVC